MKVESGERFAGTEFQGSTGLPKCTVRGFGPGSLSDERWIQGEDKILTHSLFDPKTRIAADTTQPCASNVLSIMPGSRPVIS